MAKCEKGVTLIELLAVIALLSIVLLLASSVQLFGQKQVQEQSNELQNQSDVRIAIKLITKEIRKAQKVEVTTPNELTINDLDKYKVVNNNLTKNGQPFLNNIQTFNLETDPNISFIKVTLTSIPTKNAKTVTLSTKIYLRK